MEMLLQKKIVEIFDSYANYIKKIKQEIETVKQSNNDPLIESLTKKLSLIYQNQYIQHQIVVFML